MAIKLSPADRKFDPTRATSEPRFTVSYSVNFDSYNDAMEMAQLFTDNELPHGGSSGTVRVQVTELRPTTRTIRVERKSRS